jgi:ATP-dependent exoDNAse (exonuclease V) beta subunit
VNRVFGQVMQEDKGFQPAYAPLEAPAAGGQQFLLDREGPWAPVEYWCSWDWDEGSQSAILKRSSDDVSALEAECVAQDLVRLRERGALDSWSDAMILFRTSSALDRTLRALREEGIPYAVERDRNYYRRREIIESAALVRTVLDPMDHVALVTLLRSALVGVPDAAWIPLWQGLLPSLFTRIRGIDSPEVMEVEALSLQVAKTLEGKVSGLERVQGWHHALASAAHRIGYMRGILDQHTPAYFVQELRKLFAVESVEGARFLGLYRVANLERFFRILTELMEVHGADRSRVVRELRTLVSKQMAAEEAKPLESGQDAVRVMTIHKSKGLKARHVYMMGLHRAKGNPMVFQTRGEKTRATNRAGEWEFMLFGKTTLGFQDVRDLEERIEQSESLRTLYVGMTRATERLVLLGQWPDPGRGKGKAAAQSHLVPLQECTSVLPEVVEAFSECGVSGRSAVDIDGQRWVFPVLIPKTVKSAHTLLPPPLPSLNEVKTNLEERKARRSGALERQSRPLGQAVTAIQSATQDHRAASDTVGVDALVAALAGTAVHAFMEHFDAQDPLCRASEFVAQALESEVEKVLSGLDLSEAQGAEVLERSRRCLSRFMDKELFENFCTLQPNVVARELSLILPAKDDMDSLSYVSGTLDMLYRDPTDGGFVVVDYKTDEVEPNEAQVRAKEYALQGQIYCDTVDKALPNAHPARFELWFLYSGTRVPLRRSQ